MVTLSALHEFWGARTSDGWATLARRGRTSVRRAMYVARGVLGALFAAELVVPEADPDRVRWLLVDLGHLDSAAPPQAGRAALMAFQRGEGLPAHGVADGRTVSVLVKAAREQWELRDLGLATARSHRPKPPAEPLAGPLPLRTR